VSEAIYIMLPVHNRRDITRRFIECLKIQTYQKYHLILIDDGSSDGTAEMVRENISSLTFITGTGNWWWAGSLQQGYQWLKRQNIPATDLVLIINDDTEFEADFLQNAICYLRSRERTLLLAWCYCRESGRLLDAGVHVNWSRFSFEQATTPSEINCLSTRGLFMRVSDFFAIGGFYPRFLPHYASDYEFTIRARRQGMQLVSDATCWLRVDQGTTGFHKLSSGSLRNFGKIIFSNRSVENPFMWSAFIILCCPWRYKLINLFRAWWNFFGTIYQTIRFWIIDRKIMLGRLRKPLRVVLGAGVRGQKGWLSTDINHLNILLNEDWQRYFRGNSIDALLAEHLWEHLSEEDASAAASNCFTYLKQGGYLRIAVPDGFHPSSEYIDAVKPMGSGFGSKDHKVLFTYISLSRLFESAGFDVELLEYFDESGDFHQKEWDPNAGFVARSMNYDLRNRDGSLSFTSIILDARKKRIL
jgi:predicted SAM-dependent methyltransferase